MNRLCHLKETLPRNIEDNADCDDLEFVVLDYNSDDGLGDWIRENYMDLIQAGRLSYFRESEAKSFRPAHSRNVSFRCATGDIVCNVDADNCTNKGFASLILDHFSCRYHPIIACSYDFFTWKAMSTHGRVAVRRQHFFRMGGYDEAMLGWGAEDTDLINRCLLAGFERFEIKPEYFDVIDHGDDMRVENVNFDHLEEIPEDDEERKDASNLLNCDWMSWKRNHEYFVANVGVCWGKAIVEKNFSEILHLRNPWIGL
jgi:glycosyltransferase involved in cell wall biosynthesis